MTMVNGLENKGTIHLNSTGGNTILNFNGGDQTITGTGTIVMSNNATNRILSSSSTLTHGAGHTIRGAGNLLQNSGGMVNKGTIIADQSTALTIDPNALGFSNEGTITASGSSVIVLGLGSDSMTNAMNGRINGDGTVKLSTNFSNQGTISAEEGGLATRLNIEGDVVNTGSSTIDVRMAGGHPR